MGLTIGLTVSLTTARPDEKSAMRTQCLAKCAWVCRQSNQCIEAVTVRHTSWHNCDGLGNVDPHLQCLHISHLVQIPDFDGAIVGAAVQGVGSFPESKALKQTLRGETNLQPSHLNGANSYERY